MLCSTHDQFWTSEMKRHLNVPLYFISDNVSCVPMLEIIMPMLHLDVFECYH